MIFDADTHISPYKNFPEATSAEMLDERLAQAGIDRALTWLLPQEVDDVSESNRYIYDSSRKYDRFIPFGWANVMEGEDKAVQDAIICLEEYGFAGVKLNGAQNYYPIDGLPAMHVCEEIARRDGIIAFHIGYDEPIMTSPFRAATVANAFPETTVLMVHMGGASPCERNNAGDVIGVAKLCPNMMLIGSAIGTEDVRRAILELGSDRVMFGSDTPFRNPADCVHAYEEMLADFDPADRESVLFGNALRLFKLGVKRS